MRLLGTQQFITQTRHTVVSHLVRIYIASFAGDSMMDTPPSVSGILFALFAAPNTLSDETVGVAVTFLVVVLSLTTALQLVTAPLQAKY